jgi:hypothetical protein
MAVEGTLGAAERQCFREHKPGGGPKESGTFVPISRLVSHLRVRP